MKNTITLGHFILAGTPAAGKDSGLWPRMHPNLPVQLVRERHNPHDPLAILVCTTGGRAIGYIRRDDNRILSAIMDQEVALSGHIARIEKEEHHYPREVQVAITMPAPV